MTATAYTLETNPASSRAGFKTWRGALLEDAIRERGFWRRPDQRFVFQAQGATGSAILGSKVALGLDPIGEDWIVQINEGAEPGNANVLSAIALDGAKRPFLLRQGRLQKNRLSPALSQEEFAARTGLQKVYVIDGDTAKVARDWYVVTPLDVPNAIIRNKTALFIDICETGRVGVGNATILHKRQWLRELYASDETGGFYKVGSRDARAEKAVAKIQGDVWVFVAEVLRAKGAKVEKPGLGGYAVDAEITYKKRRILLEIKSGIVAQDVYGGVGQLYLYRKLMPALSDHTPVLLLPGLPSPILKKAVEDCGINVCTFGYEPTDRGAVVTLSPEFLKLCGIGPD